MTAVDTDRETIESLLATSDVYVTVTMETANAQNASAQRWHCHITQYNAFGALVHVFNPLHNKELLLLWAAILTIEPVPSYE